jgi:hypothetical protein
MDLLFGSGLNPLMFGVVPLIGLLKLDCAPPAMEWYSSINGATLEVILGPIIILSLVPKNRGMKRGNPRSNGIRSSKPKFIRQLRIQGHSHRPGLGRKDQKKGRKLALGKERSLPTKQHCENQKLTFKPNRKNNNIFSLNFH